MIQSENRLSCEHDHDRDIESKNKRTSITSIPRDAYVEIVGKGFKDKINHAHSFGAPK